MNLDTIAIKIFLKEVQLINIKYEERNKENQFEIFSILREPHEEVGLHSRFIYELLNPQGTHNQDSIFLEKFVGLFLADWKFDCKTAEVYREKTCENGRIDILIQNKEKTHAIIIENKIYCDNNYDYEQLAKYYEAIKNQGFQEIKVIYLTLDGREPNGESAENLHKEDILLIAYNKYNKTVALTKDEREEHQRENRNSDSKNFNTSNKSILDWIKSCIEIEEVALKPKIRETLVQYKILIKKLTEDTMENAQKLEILGLLKQSKENSKSYFSIIESCDYIKDKIIGEIWKELESKMEEVEDVSNVELYTDDRGKWLFFDYKNKITLAFDAWKGVRGSHQILPTFFGIPKKKPVKEKNGIKYKNLNDQFQKKGNTHWYSTQLTNLDIKDLILEEEKKEVIENLCKEVLEFAQKELKSLLEK